MLITKKVKINKNPSNFKKYSNLGYEDVNGFFEIKIKDVSKNSRVSVKVKCDFCGKEKETPYRLYFKNIEKYNLYSCSNKCSSYKNKLTNLKRYGVDYPTQNPNIIKKIKETNLEKYGAEWFIQSKYFEYDLKKKNEQYNHMKKICEEKYGNEIYNKTKHSDLKRNETIKKFQKTMKNKKYEKYSNLIKIEKNIYYFKCNKCHNEFKIERCQLKNREKYNIEICTICNSLGKRFSYSESLFLEKLKKLTKNKIIVNSRKIIPPYELDAYIPKLKIAFEFNGLYWHNMNHKSVE